MGSYLESDAASTVNEQKRKCEVIESAEEALSENRKRMKKTPQSVASEMLIENNFRHLVVEDLKESGVLSILEEKGIIHFSKSVTACSDRLLIQPLPKWEEIITINMASIGFCDYMDFYIILRDKERVYDCSALLQKLKIPVVVAANKYYSVLGCYGSKIDFLNMKILLANTEIPSFDQIIKSYAMKIGKVCFILINNFELNYIITILTFKSLSLESK